MAADPDAGREGCTRRRRRATCPPEDGVRPPSGGSTPTAPGAGRRPGWRPSRTGPRDSRRSIKRRAAGGGADARQPRRARPPGSGTSRDRRNGGRRAFGTVAQIGRGVTILFGSPYSGTCQEGIACGRTQRACGSGGLEAAEAGETTAELSDRFAVSPAWVHRLGQWHRATGEVAPRTAEDPGGARTPRPPAPHPVAACRRPGHDPGRAAGRVEGDSRPVHPVSRRPVAGLTFKKSHPGRRAGSVGHGRGPGHMGAEEGSRPGPA